MCMLKPGPDARLETLSETPRICCVANALDRASCEALMASEAASQMTTSNAPAAQLDPEKLTLLAPLILLAPLRVVGAPANGDDLPAAALPPLIGATAAAAALAYLALKLADASASGRRTSGAGNWIRTGGNGSALADSRRRRPRTRRPSSTRGEKFALHGDALGDQGRGGADEGGQRVATQIPHQRRPGGGRHGPRPRQFRGAAAGDACVFFPSHPSKEPDPLTTHHSASRRRRGSSGLRAGAARAAAGAARRRDTVRQAV